MFNHLQTFPNLCENLYSMQLMSFLNLKVLRGKPTKSKGLMPHLKLKKKMLSDKEIEKQTKIAIHINLWKYC